MNHEKNISTRTIKTRTQARISSPDEDQGRTTNHQGAARAWSDAPGSLTGHTTGVGNASTKFRRECRLNNSEDFTCTLRTGRRRNGVYFSLYFCATRLGFARLGIAVGRRVAGKATRRNRIKRSLREAFRRRAAVLPSIDIVVLAKRGVTELDNETLHRQLDGMWARLEKDARRQKAAKSTPPA